MIKKSLIEGRVFVGLLVLLVWLPMPFASNRIWAEAIFEAWIAILAMFWLREWYRGRVEIAATLIKAKPILLLLILWLIYLGFTLLPLPLPVCVVLSSESAAFYSVAGVNQWASLSVDPYAGFLYLLKSLGYVLLFALILLLVNTKQRLVMLAYVLVLSGFCQAFYGSMMTLSGAEYGFFIKKADTSVGVATGTFINRNHLAGYLEMTLAIGIGLLMASGASGENLRTWRQHARSIIALLLSPKMILRLLLAMMVITLVLTRSRMGNTAFFTSMLVAGSISLMIFRKKYGSVREMFSHHDTRAAVILLSSLMVIDLFIVGTWFGAEKVVARIEQTSVAHDIGRIEVSQNTLKLWQDYPWFGSGGGSFHAVYPRYRPESIDAYYDHTHQDYLEIAADTGIIGLSLLGAVVLASFSAAIAALHRRSDRLMRGMAFASVMGIIALMIHSTVDFNLQIPANSATFMVLLALAWIALYLDSHVHHKNRSSNGAASHAR